MGRKALVADTTRVNKDVAFSRRRVLLSSVASKTLAGYKGKILILENFCATVRGWKFDQCAKTIGKESSPEQRVQLDKDVWFLFCEEFAQRSSNASKSALEAYRSAVGFFQTLGDVEGDWANDDDVIRATAASRYEGGKRKMTRKRGALTSEMFEELLKWLKAVGETRFEELLIVLFGTHARITEIVELKGEDVVAGGIWIPNKAYRVATMEHEEPRILKPASVLSAEAWSILERRSREAKHSTSLLFPCKEGRVHELRAVLKRACEELDWDEDVLKFDVPHCLRHGRVTDLVSEGRGSEVKMAPNTLRRYGKPNASRR